MTITIETILDTITEQAKAHDEFIGSLIKKYDLPDDGSAKTDEYDEPMTDMLVDLSDDIEERFNYILDLYGGQELDEHGQIWLEGTKEMLEALEEALEEIDNKEEYENVPFDTHANREAMEETYMNEHEAFEAMHKGAKTVWMLSMIEGLG